jgi:hypothetical protein
VDEMWRKLNLSDKVKLHEWPSELQREHLHAETQQLYDWLISSGSVLTITRIDDDGTPWGEICIERDGRQIWESIGLNHSGLELCNE